MKTKTDNNPAQVPYAIFIDGAAPDNQNGCTQGGIGIVVFDEESNIIDEVKIAVERATDSAEVELMALVEGLEYAIDGETIYSDSAFCVKGYNEWLDGWKAKGWRKANKKTSGLP